MIDKTNVPTTLLRWAKISSTVLLVFAVAAMFDLGRDFFITADQRGQRLADQGQWQQAAENFADPLRQANAYYQAGDFEQAASIYGGLPGPVGAYNRGNALVMLGKYDDAIGQYNVALQSRPDWEAAKINREIAKARADRLKFEGGDMTGGKLGADDIVFDQSESSTNTRESETVEGAAELSDQEMRAVWLRQVQTTPSDFLKSKFAYQLAKQRDQPKEAND